MKGIMVQSLYRYGIGGTPGDCPRSLAGERSRLDATKT
jgi:hypothetical protein